MRILEIIISFVLGSVLGMFIMNWLNTPIFEDRINYQVVRFSEIGSKVYLSSRAWGITGGSEEVRVCDKPINFQEDKAECLIFHTTEVFYKRDRANRLIIRAFDGQIARGNPERLGAIEVVVNPFKNGKERDDLITNYEKQGYQKITLPY
ncbi:MAG: hypothetical protein ABL984_11185 [Pyrinomonadaceae bacterium]